MKTHALRAFASIVQLGSVDSIIDAFATLRWNM